MRKFYSFFLLSLYASISTIIIALNVIIRIFNQIDLAPNFGLPTATIIGYILLVSIFPILSVFIFLRFASLKRIDTINPIYFYVLNFLLFFPVYLVSLMSWAKLTGKTEFSLTFNLDSLGVFSIYSLLLTSIHYLINYSHIESD